MKYLHEANDYRPAERLMNKSRARDKGLCSRLQYKCYFPERQTLVLFCSSEFRFVLQVSVPNSFRAESELVLTTVSRCSVLIRVPILTRR